MLRRSNGCTRIDDLMLSDQGGQRQIQELLGALIDQPAPLLERLVILTPDRERRADRLGARGDGIQGLERLLRDHRAHTRLEDTRLFTGDLLNRRTQPLRVIQRNRRDDGKRRARHDVGGVEPSAEPYFQDQDIGRTLGKGEKSRRRRDLEKSHDIAGVGVLNPRQVVHKCGLSDRCSLVAGPGEFDPLMEANEMRGGVDVHASAGRLQHRLQVGRQ